MRCVSSRVPGAWCRVLGAGAGCWVLLGGLVLAQQPVQPAQMPSLPLTQLEEGGIAADLDNRTFSLAFAQPVPIKDLLLLLVRGTNLSVVPDPAIAGTFFGELKNVTVRQALGLILPPVALDYAVDGSFIRVFKRQAETRIFEIDYAAVERVGASTVAGEGGGRSSASVATSGKTDLFGDLSQGVRSLLSEQATFNLDRKAGLIQVTDFPDRLERVGWYLDAVQTRVHRQAQIDTRLVEVELNDEQATGIDWTVLSAGLAAAPIPGGRAANRPPLTGLRVTDVARLMTLLAAQGKVAVTASPRLLTLNNEPAIARTDAVTFSVTPQIAGDAVVTLSLTPIVKGPTVFEADMIARVADGETLVVWGFTGDRDIRERRNVGWFRRKTAVTRKRVEILLLLTPKII